MADFYRPPLVALAKPQSRQIAAQQLTRPYLSLVLAALFTPFLHFTGP